MINIIMEKIKSRWRKNYLEGDIINNDEAKDDNSDTGEYTTNLKSNSKHDNNTDHHHQNHNHNHSNINSNSNNNNSGNKNTTNNHHHHRHHHSKHSVPPTYEPLTENLYLDKRKADYSRSRKDARSMVCDCILTREERARGIMGCLDDCLNRMLMIECGAKCTLGDHCLNKRFQKFQSAKVEMFKTKKKGWGLRAVTELPANSFIMEYVGEVVRSKEFRSRVKKYTKQKIKHHYFMALRSDEIIDATVKGNLTRFINHSCEPNCETQKWTVNGDLRIGFFTIKNLQPGDEITFDYQFQRYGRKAQKCYCEAPSCRGFIGGDEQTFSLNGHSSPQLNENKQSKKSYKHGLLVDVTLEDKINALAEDAASGLKTKDQVIALASLSIKAEDVGDRRKLLDIIKTTKSEISLRLFVDYHGLEIICLWMRDPQADSDFKATIIDILEKLPIPNKTKVVESNVYRMIERWATEEPKSILPPTEITNNINNSNHNIENEKRKKEDTEEDDQNTNKSQESNKSTEFIKEDSNSQPSLKATPPTTPSKEILSSSNTLLPQKTVNSPNIKALANKLLKKFQALSPGFKIPRLNRLQRMEIEKKMDEEVISDDAANNDKLVFDQKNPFASRNYFKSTNTTTSSTNGLVNSTLKSSILPVRRRFDSLTTNNIDLTPAPKISKEEHRQQFEMHVRLKDYYDTIEKHYGAAAVEQIKLSQSRSFNSALNGLSHLHQFPPHVQATQNHLSFLNTNHHIPPTPLIAPQAPPPLLSSAAVVAAAAAAAVNTNPATHLMYLNPHLHNNGQHDVALAFQTNGRDYSNDSYHELYSAQQKEPEIEPETTIVNTTLNDVEMKAVKPEPTNMPTLKILANNSIEPTHLIDDDLAFSICGYDEYYTNRNKPMSVDDIKEDDPFPYPGSYYTTPNGETWFATVTLDRKTQQPRTVILNLQTRSDAGQSQTVSPSKQPQVSNSSYNTIDEPKESVIASSIETITESPTTNNSGDKIPGKMKKKMFEHGVSKFIKDALSEYYKPNCQVARITSKEDFVFLARKLTLAVLEKELNRKGGCERLECNKQVKRKVEDFVRIYMAKFGKLYIRNCL